MATLQAGGSQRSPVLTRPLPAVGPATGYSDGASVHRRGGVHGCASTLYYILLASWSHPTRVTGTPPSCWANTGGAVTRRCLDRAAILFGSMCSKRPPRSTPLCCYPADPSPRPLHLPPVGSCRAARRGRRRCRWSGIRGSRGWRRRTSGAGCRWGGGVCVGSGIGPAGVHVQLG